MESSEITCHMDALYGYAMILTRDPASASDLVQETYLKAMPAMERLHENSNVKAWLFAILRNTWLNHLRKHRSQPTMVDLDEERSEHVAANRYANPDDVYTTEWTIQQVRAAIQQLSADFREIILLREYEELSYQEIAELLQCPAGTVMSRLARARARLRDLLSAEMVSQHSRRVRS